MFELFQAVAVGTPNDETDLQGCADLWQPWTRPRTPIDVRNEARAMVTTECWDFEP